MYPGKITAGEERTRSLRHIQQKANVIDTQLLLMTLLPVDSRVIEVLYAICLRDNHYCAQRKRWIGLPDSPEVLEKDMYLPFILIAKAIHDAVRGYVELPAGTKSLVELQHGNNAPVELVNGSWNALPNTSPKSRDEESADIRPDIDFALTSLERARLTNVVSDLVQKLAEMQKEHTRLSDKVPRTTRDQEDFRASVTKLEAELKDNLNKLEETMKRWWLQLHNVVELKRGNSTAEHGEASVQTVSGMRYILREQLNRRFVFGLTLCFAQMDVWLCDRSGLLGTATSIDINEDPKSFIRILAAFSILRPDQLGWDTTMKLYVPVKNEYVAPYLQNFCLDQYNGSAYDAHWAIDMPAKHPPEGRETFITIRCVSAIGVKEVDGRASIAWEAVRKVELPKPKKIYVLKQSWRPSMGMSRPTAGKMPSASSVTSDPPMPNEYGEARSEAEMYSRVNKALEESSDSCDPDSKYIAQLYSHEDVVVAGEVDTTWGLIRQNLYANVSRDQPAPTAGTKRTRADSYETPIHEATITSDRVHILVTALTKFPTPRIHTRIVLETFGWPVKYFLDLEELLRIFIESIKGHRFLYLRAGIIQRDVSSGNLLICPRENGQTTGCIIDLDHAKAAPRFTELYGREDKMPAALSSRLRGEPVEQEILEMMWSRLSSIAPERDPLEFRSPMQDYIFEAVRSMSQPPDHPLTCRELGWDMERPLRRPCFDTYVPINRARTGTLPYMSGEVLLNDHILYPFRGQTDDDTPQAVHFHDAVHDIESFFWVLIYLCMTRSGPGGHRREELLPHEPDEPTKSLWHTIFCLFDGDEDTLLLNKTAMLRKKRHLANYVLSALNPYFKDLEELIKDWWALMIRAYSFRLIEYDTIHDRVLKLLETTLNAIQKISEGAPEHPSTRMEHKRREKELDRLYHPFGAVPSASRPTTPVRSRGPSTVAYSPGMVPDAGRPKSGASLGLFAPGASLFDVQQSPSDDAPLAKKHHGLQGK